MLGRIAKGVGGLAKGVAGVALGENRAALTVQNDESEVESLLQRISGSLLPESRRQAMSQLKELLADNPKAQLAFASMGIPVLVAVLRDDRDDLALLTGALEALVATTTGVGGAGGGAAGGAGNGQLGEGLEAPQHYPQHYQQNGMSAAEAQAAALTADLFTRSSDHVALLLGLLEDEPVGVPDFYVRYHTVQLLTALMVHCGGRLQEAVLATPMSVARLTELLGERSEIIRNEALLLLVSLTRPELAAGLGGRAGGGSGEVQKIAAFGGAFDRLVELLQEEGGLEGGMVVQDCLELMNNLLRGNVANQRLFREMGHAAAVLRLLTASLPPPATAQNGAGGAAGARHPGSASIPATPAAGPAGGGGPFAPTAGPIPFLNPIGTSAGAGGGFFTSNGGGVDGGVFEQPEMELRHALASLAEAGSESLLGLTAHQLPRQKAVNMLGMLETLRLLCAPPTAQSDPDRATEVSNLAANQTKLLAAGMLEALTVIALQDGGLPHSPVRIAALMVLAQLVEGHTAAAERLACSNVRLGADGNGAPAAVVRAVVAILRVALYANDVNEQAVAEHVIECYCRRNPEGQISLAMTIGPMDAAAATAGTAYMPYSTAPSALPYTGQSLSFGQELVAALIGSGSSSTAAAATGMYGSATASAPATAAAVNSGSTSGGGLLLACRAAGVLQHLLAGNVATKERLLTTQLACPPPPGVPPDLLMPRLFRALSSALCPSGAGDAPCLLVASLLRLLLVWLYDCPPAAIALLAGAAHLPLLADLVTARQGPAGEVVASAAEGGDTDPGAARDTVVCGLAACVLAACILCGKPPAADPSGGCPPADLVLDVVMSRVGLSLFFFRLDDLRRSPCMAAAAAGGRSGHPAAAATRFNKQSMRNNTTASAGAEQQQQQQLSGEGTLVVGSKAGGGSSWFVLGQDLAGIVAAVEEGARQRLMEVFARPQRHRDQEWFPASPVEMPGPDDTSRLSWAVSHLGRTAREAEQLRARNRALAEDLLRLSQSLGSAPPAANGSLGPGGPATAQPPTPHPGSVGSGGPPGGHGRSMVTSAADVEARVALELRAGRAEQEVAVLKQQLEYLAARLSQAEADAAAAREASAAGTLAASKAVADLADLSSAYNTLETHAFATEAQLRTAQAAVAEARQEAAAGRAAAAAAAAGHSSSLQGATEAEVQRRIDAAVAKAQAEAKAEADDAMNDLFVCLGQEERKVAVLRQALEQRGVDVDGLLASIAEEEGDEDVLR